MQANPPHRHFEEIAETDTWNLPSFDSLADGLFVHIEEDRCFPQADQNLFALFFGQLIHSRRMRADLHHFSVFRAAIA